MYSLPKKEFFGEAKFNTHQPFFGTDQNEDFRIFTRNLKCVSR